jgi:uncharacterized membrane protein (DUF2068 family)
MSRSGLITALAVVQLLIGAVWLSIAFYLLALMRSPEIANDPGALQGLRIGFVSIVVFAVPTLISAIALWKVRQWGRWLAIAVYALTLCALLYSPVFEHDTMDGSDITMSIVFAVLIVVFSLPQIGRQFRMSSPQSAVSIPE